jgi:hypothetical protein
VDVLSVLDRVARAMESVVPGLSLTAEVGGQVWLEEETDNPDGSVESSGRGEWVTELGFAISYRYQHFSAFSHASAGSERERIQTVALQLMSDVQDIVTEITTEPWPLIVVNGRKDMALADAAIEADDLHMWYGERDAPALRLPSVQLL